MVRRPAGRFNREHARPGGGTALSASYAVCIRRYVRSPLRTVDPYASQRVAKSQREEMLVIALDLLPYESYDALAARRRSHRVPDSVLRVDDSRGTSRALPPPSTAAWHAR